MANNPYAQPAPHDGADFGVPMEPARTSVLAVISLISSLICCIPALGLLGVGFGVLAIILISSSKGRVGGTGLAVAGVVIGLLVSAVWLLLLFGGVTIFNQFKTIPEVMTAVENRDIDAVKAEFVPAKAQLITDEVLEDFASAVGDAHGTFDKVPGSIGEALGMYSDFNSTVFATGGDFEQTLQNHQSIGRNVIPLPAHFTGGPVIFAHVWPVQMDNPPMSPTNGMPLVENIGVSDGNGWIWLLPPATVTTVPNTPQTPDTPENGGPAESEAAEEADDPASGDGEETTAPDAETEADPESETVPEPSEPAPSDPE